MNGNDWSQRLALEQLFLGYRVTQSIYVVARLGIADLLQDGPRTSEDLARVTATQASSLYRVLRLLAAVGLFTEGEGHSFALTPRGSYLRSGVPGSMHNMVLFFGDREHWQVWGELLRSVETGEPAYRHVFGLTVWEYHAQHPEQAALFNDFETEYTAGLAPAVAAAYDFSACGTLVDVGGGRGQLLAAILRAYPTLHGLLIDLPHVVEGAPGLLQAAGVADRCEVIGGDAFADLPVGDAYLLSRVIRGWGDERSTALLVRCRQSMRPSGKVLLLERVVPTSGLPEPLAMQSDVNLLVTAGGKERTDTEYHALLNTAGLEFTRLIPVLPPYYLIEARMYDGAGKSAESERLSH
jgi:hypothetical protein